MSKRRMHQLFPFAVFLMILLFASIPLKNVMASNTSVSKVLINKDSQYLEFILQGKNVKFEGNKIIMGVGDTLEIIAHDSFSHPQYSRELLFSETEHIEWLLKQPYINAYSHDYLENFPRGDTYDPYLFFDAYDRSNLDSYGTYTARKEGKYEVAISYGFIVNIAQKRTNHYYQGFELIIIDLPFSEATAASKPQSPTLSNFNISPTVVEKGEHLSISGKINGNGNRIIAVSVGVRNASNEEFGGYWGHEKNLNVDTFDLSSFGKLKAGDKIGNTPLEPGEYIVQVYVTTDTGLTFEKEQKTTITVKEKAVEYPTLSNFKVSPSTAEEGESFSISGKINGNGNKITAVSVGVRNAANEDLGGYWGEKKNISKSSFDLSSFGKLKAGEKLGNTTLSTGDYIVQVYVTTDSGLSFKKEQTATITIEEKEPVVIGAPKWQDEKKEITSEEDDVYLYYHVDDGAEYVLLEYEGCDKNGEAFEKASLGAYPVKKRFGYVLSFRKEFPYGFNDKPFSQFTAPISKMYLTVCDENENPLSETSAPLYIYRTDLMEENVLAAPEWVHSSHDIYSSADAVDMLFRTEKGEYISLLFEEYNENGELINAEWDSTKYNAYKLDSKTFTLGEPFVGFTAPVTKVYMMVCDATGNRLSDNSAPMTVNLKENINADGACVNHDFSTSTVYDHTLFAEIAGDDQFHLGYADVFHMACSVCGVEQTSENPRNPQLTLEHDYVDGVCQTEGCKHVCSHLYANKGDSNGNPVLVSGSGVWESAGKAGHVCSSVTYVQRCAYCRMERNNTVSDPYHGEVQAHILNAEDVYDWNDDEHWVAKVVESCSACAYSNVKDVAGKHEAHRYDANGKCVVCMSHSIKKPSLADTQNREYLVSVASRRSDGNISKYSYIPKSGFASILVDDDEEFLYFNVIAKDGSQTNLHTKRPSSAQEGDLYWLIDDSSTICATFENEYCLRVAGESGTVGVTLYYCGDYIENDQKISDFKLLIKKNEYLDNSSYKIHSLIIEDGYGTINNGRHYSEYSMVVDVKDVWGEKTKLTCQIIENNNRNNLFLIKDAQQHSFQLKVDGKGNGSSVYVDKGRHVISLWVDGIEVDSKVIYCMDSSEWTFEGDEITCDGVYQENGSSYYRAKFNRAEFQTLFDKRFDECSIAVIADDGIYNTVLDEKTQKVVNKAYREGQDYISLRHSGFLALEIDNIASFEFKPQNMWLYCVAPWGEYYFVQGFYATGVQKNAPQGILDRLVYGAIDTVVGIGEAMYAASDRYQQNGNTLVLWMDSLSITNDIFTGLSPIELASEAIADGFYQEFLGITESDQQTAQALKTLLTDVINLEVGLPLDPLKDYSDKSIDYMPSYNDGFTAQITLTDEIVKLYGLEEFLTEAGLEETKLAQGGYSLFVSLGSSLSEQVSVIDVADTVISWGIEEWNAEVTYE